MTANLIFVLTVVVTVINSQRQEIHHLPNLKKWFMEIFRKPAYAIGSSFLWSSLMSETPRSTAVGLKPKSDPTHSTSRTPIHKCSGFLGAGNLVRNFDCLNVFVRGGKSPYRNPLLWARKDLYGMLTGNSQWEKEKL
jgi:hypothetical protein